MGHRALAPNRPSRRQGMESATKLLFALILIRLIGGCEVGRGQQLVCHLIERGLRTLAELSGARSDTYDDPSAIPSTK